MVGSAAKTQRILRKIPQKGWSHMSRSKKTPSYRLHKQSGQAIVTLNDGLGGRRDVLLGKHGTPESYAEYDRCLAEWIACGRRLRTTDNHNTISINELLLRFWDHAQDHYRKPDGSPSNELVDFKLSMRPLRELYGTTAAKDFGPLALKAIRQRMMEPDATRKNRLHQKGLARGVINQRIGRIRRVFRWAVENELVPAAIYQGLMAVRGLERGRTKARETELVKPVPLAIVEETIPYLRPQVAAMVRLQLHTGARPGEITIMRGLDLETSGKVWFYRPGSDCGPHGDHKTAYRGHARVIAIGPRGQEVLRPWLRLILSEFLFQPREAEESRRLERRANRQSPMTPSQAKRKRRDNPAYQPKDHYTVASYGRAIARACIRADEKAHEKRHEVSAEVLVPHWHPHQLRHTKATEVRREAGLDAARVVLGHRSPSITETYAEIDTSKAEEIMLKLG
jgi:integrase